MTLTKEQLERIGRYLSVRKHPTDPKRRTVRWTVLTNHGDALGAVQWFPRWRQYCFDPRESTTFNEGCLRDLATFLERVNREHRTHLAICQLHPEHTGPCHDGSA